ncbi:MAG: nitrite reductase small subunit NirD [Burkholderiales bacterium]
MGHWIDACALEDIPRLGARRLRRAGGIEIAIFRTADDAVFALLDQCPHKGGPLSQGIVFGHRVACPLHNWSIELASGEAVAPDVGCAQRYDVKVEAGRVLVDIEESALQTAQIPEG